MFSYLFCFKISMDFQSSEKFCHLLKCALDVMSQMLEMSETLEMSKNAEEILCYLKSLMVMEPCSSVQCVRQVSFISIKNFNSKFHILLNKRKSLYSL